jgi:hypothetical protein
LAITVPAGSWLIQAKYDVNNDGTQVAFTLCGLIEGATQLDFTRNVLSANANGGERENEVMTAVLNDDPAGSTIALRCREQPGENLNLGQVSITALRVESVTGP